MTDELYTQTGGGIRYWTREELLIRAETAEAEVAALRVRIAELEAALNHQNTLRESLSDMIGIQSQDGNWNYNDYMCGLANGLLLAHATMTEGAYKPFSRPAQWIEEAKRTPPTEAPAP